MKLLAEGARRFGLALTPAQLEQFRKYCDELMEWNRRFNLTAIEERDQIQVKHFLDSLSLLTVWRPEGQPSVMDVGAGAGFPGLPLKIVCPQLRLTLVEAAAKKVEFLRHIIALLGLSDVIALHERAEALGRRPPYREQYDLVVARAVAALPELAEYTLPFARVGGLVAAYKGPAAAQEVQAAEFALAVLGGRLERLVRVEVPGLAEERCLVLIRKAAPTPAQYPRRPGIPHKRPLVSTAREEG
ncbi:MAG: 16S rRNA (guanine(527)-N(7))-methyltransferase RsmG [Anaerolineae bacterium]